MITLIHKQIIARSKYYVCGSFIMPLILLILSKDTCEPSKYCNSLIGFYYYLFSSFNSFIHSFTHSFTQARLDICILKSFVSILD